MSVIALERPAIEELLRRTSTAAHRPPGFVTPLTLDGTRLRFLGVSRPQGVNSSLPAHVGVFVEEPGEHESGDLNECEAFVLVRPPTDEERTHHPLSRSALRAVELLTPTEHDGQLRLARTNHHALFVSC